METNAEDEKLVKELAAMPMHSFRQASERPDSVMIQRVPGGWNYLYYDESAVVFIAIPKSFMCEF